MLKLIYMLDIPGSGKSYRAKKIAKQERAEIFRPMKSEESFLAMIGNKKVFSSLSRSIFKN